MIERCGSLWLRLIISFFSIRINISLFLDN